MQSSNIELVLPRDGRGETRYYMIINLVVLVIADTLLWLNHQASQRHLSTLPVELNHSATQISNAIAELNMLEEAGMLAGGVTLADLPLPNVGAHRFVTMEDDCFVVHTGQHLFAVERTVDEHAKGSSVGVWQAHWAVSDLIEECHAPLDWHELNQ